MPCAVDSSTTQEVNSVVDTTGYTGGEKAIQLILRDKSEKSVFSVTTRLLSEEGHGQPS